MSLSDIFSSDIRHIHRAPLNDRVEIKQCVPGGTSSDWFLVEYETLGRKLKEDVEKHKRALQLTTTFHANTTRVVQCEGENIFRLAMQLLDKFKWKRSPDQKRFHDAIFLTAAPHIYGSDFLTCRDQILDQFQRSEFPLAAMIMTPRRWGKTTASAMAAAVLMYVGRRLNILVFSTGQRMSTLFAQKVKTYFCELPGGAERIIVNNTSTFEVSAFDCPKNMTKQSIHTAGLTNKLSALASSVKGTKGVTADIIILEEASRIPKSLLTETCAPLLKVANAVLIALSTRLGPENYYSKLFERDDDIANRILLRLRIELMCEECKSDNNNAFDCKHLDHLLPPWLLASNAERVQVLMGDDEEMYAQEVLGVDLSGKYTLLPPSVVDNWKTRPRQLFEAGPQDVIVTMVDPAGGGSSQTALVTICIQNNAQYYIVGISEMDAKNEADLITLIGNYFRQVQHMYTRSRHVIAVENNYGGGIIADIVLQRAKAYLPRLLEIRTHIKKPGVVTTQRRKNAAVLRLLFLLRSNNLVLPYDIITYECGQDKRDLSQLCEQFGRLRKEFSPKNPEKWKYTAKLGDTGRDDMCIALLLGIFYAEAIVQRQVSGIKNGYIILNGEY